VDAGHQHDQGGAVVRVLVEEQLGQALEDDLLGQARVDGRLEGVEVEEVDQVCVGGFRRAGRQLLEHPVELPGAQSGSGIVGHVDSGLKGIDGNLIGYFFLK